MRDGHPQISSFAADYFPTTDCAGKSTADVVRRDSAWLPPSYGLGGADQIMHAARVARGRWSNVGQLAPHVLLLTAERRITRMRVLVVDDEPLVRWALTQMLEENGCVVVESEDACSARREAARERFDLVLLDYNLPDSRDFELLRTLRRLAPARPVVMMSARLSHEETAEARRLGAVAIIPKPFDLDVVWRLILQVRRPH
jgi:CheY-like chemotaxis protein